MIEVIAIIISSITLMFTIINQINIIKDKEPQLSFSLKSFNNILYLMVTNNGGTSAKNIRIKVKKIHNNGNRRTQEDQIFEAPFELASNEIIQGMIEFDGENSYNHIFPYIDIEVRYQKPHFRKNVKYERKVFYNASAERKIKEKTNLKLNNIEHNTNNMHKSLLRLANYFDGNELAPCDELNIVSKNHFQKDLLNIKKGVSSKIKSREETMESRF